jgi:hypothetical protein
MASKKTVEKEVVVELVFDVTPVPESTEHEPYVYDFQPGDGSRKLIDGSRLHNLKHLSEYIQSAWEQGGMIVADLAELQTTYNTDGGHAGTAHIRTLRIWFANAEKAKAATF